MKKRIFITGISSMLMKELTKKIDFSLYDVIGLTRNKSIVSSSNCKIIYGDLNELTTYKSYLNNSDILIHAAAVTHAFFKKEYQKTNVDATKIVIDAANKTAIKKIVYISSNTASKNSGAYGKSKLDAENYIRKNCENWTILRLSEVFGANNNEGIEKLIQDTIKKSYVLCPKGMRSKFSPIHIDDVTKLLFQYIFTDFQNNTIKNINGNGKYTFQEIIQLVKNHKKLVVIPLPKKVLLLVLKIVHLIPFYIGIIPDQIERLYGSKSYDTTSKNLYKLEDYIITKVREYAT